MAFQINCTCGCGQQVEARDAGFNATTVQVEACETLASAGIASQTIRKSVAYAAAAAVSVVRHREGLVAFA